VSEDEDWFEAGVDESQDTTESGPETDTTADAVEDAEPDETTEERAPAQPDTTGSGFEAEDAPTMGVDDAEPGTQEFEAAFGGERSGDDSPGGFGFGGGEPGGETAFDDEELDTEIPRIDLGIDGLDEMVQGGVPARSLIVTVGSAGTGKTTVGLQFLNEALVSGNRAVYITLEETRERILDSAAEKGWDFASYEENGQLSIIDMDPIEMANSLTSIRSELPRLVDAFEADRLVLDSVSLLEMMYDDQATRRTEVFDFTQSLKAAGVTSLLTSEADGDNPFRSRFGIIEYLTDAVFVLRYVRPDDFRETRLAVEIQKIRDANHSRETKPYEITNEGISVYQQANLF